MKNSKLLSGNALKIIAMIAMLIDHIGHILLPEMFVLRKIGRIALPIFAFMIAEGCIYTKNKVRYFLSIFLLAVLCEIGYYLAGLGICLSILITFSYSLLIIFSFQYLREKITEGRRQTILFSYIVVIGVIGMTFLINKYYRADYGFWGCMLPVFAYFPVFLNKNASHLEKMLSFAVGLIILSLSYGRIQTYSLLALPLLALYSGHRGRFNIKYLFYIFYPAHLAILYLIDCFVKN